MEAQREKKRLGCGWKILIGFVGTIAALALGAVVWFNLNRDKIVDTMLSNEDQEDLVGRELPAFDVELTDGTHVTRDALLEGKDVTVVVLFATWCGPCEEEFPKMDAVYQKYQDKMSMIAIDVDFLDSMDGLKEYQQSHNLSFPLAFGLDNETLDYVTTTTYPTTLIVDRNGVIRVHRVGSIPSEEVFEQLLTPFMGDGYTQAEPAYYTFMAYAKGNVVPGVEFSVTSDAGTQTYVTDESGQCSVFFDQRADMPIKVLSVPEGVEIVDDGQATSGTTSTIVRLPVR